MEEPLDFEQEDLSHAPRLPIKRENRSSDMKRQLPSTSSVDEPQRNVRSRNPFNASMAPNLHADHESPTSISGENINSSSGTPQGLQALAESTSPRMCAQCGALVSGLDERGNSLSSEAPPPASDPLVPFTASNLRSNIPASEERSVSLPSTSPVDESQTVVSLEQPHGFQQGVQPVAPNWHADQQSPTSVPGESNSDSSEHQSHFDGLIAPLVSAQHLSHISAPDEMGISLSSEVPPPASDPLVPSTVPYIVDRIPALRGLFPPVPPRWIPGISYTLVVNLPSVAPPFLGSVYDLPYQELLALEERIGKVNTGVKPSELSKFVKN